LDNELEIWSTRSHVIEMCVSGAKEGESRVEEDDGEGWRARERESRRAGESPHAHKH